MKFIHVVICAILLGFLAGLIYSTQSFGRSILTDKPETPQIVTVDRPSVALKPCSQTNTMPCDVSPPNVLKNKLDKIETETKLFTVGENVTCIYPLVRVTNWSDGSKEQYIQNTGLKCVVLKASEEYPDLEPNYQHIQVDCTKDMAAHNGVVGHKLNKVRWFSSTDCYHFVQSN